VLSPKLLNLSHYSYSYVSPLAQDTRENQIQGPLSLIYKTLKTGQPSYLRSLLSFPSHRRTRSSTFIEPCADRAVDNLLAPPPTFGRSIDQHIFSHHNLV